MSEQAPSESSPRAFTQGVGTVFQFVGVILFLTSMFVCCASGLLSREVATRSELNQIGWRFGRDTTAVPVYSAQQATTLCVMGGVLFGMALAGLGLGLQAQHRRAALIAVIVCAIAVVFWVVQMLMFATALHSTLLTLICAGLAAVSIVCLIFSVGAQREMRHSPPPEILASLPSGYQVPYSHMHQDPPEVRFAAELEERRRKLEVQQKELEHLEARIKRRLQQKDE
jgi:lysylphosphatidylglycerol synthetase-like protein (DUF2156 family)